MKVKTYGVPELTEWHGKVKAGTIEVAVSFTGGTSSPSGAQPAYLVTKDPITQFVIEHSKEFQNGFIIQLMSQEIAGEHPRMAKAKARVAQPVKAAEPEPEAVVPAEAAIESVADSGGESETEVEEAYGTLTEVETTCLQDAQSYLQEHYGIPSYKVRTLDAAQSAAAEHGIRFVGGKF